ncbi:unnamed protein product, partial [Gulo gulo]
RCGAGGRQAAPPPGSARCPASCHSAQRWCRRPRWPPCPRGRRPRPGLQGRVQAEGGLGQRAPLAPGNSPVPLGALRAAGKGLELQPTHGKPEATVPQGEKKRLKAISQSPQTRKEKL